MVFLFGIFLWNLMAVFVRLGVSILEADLKLLSNKSALKLLGMFI